MDNQSFPVFLKWYFNIVSDKFYGRASNVTRFNISKKERLIAIVVGSIIYQLLILVVIKLGFDTTYLKLFSAIILAICLMIPQLKKALNLKTGFEKEA